MPAKTTKTHEYLMLLILRRQQLVLVGSVSLLSLQSINAIIRKKIEKIK